MKLYGMGQSRSFRALWALEESGLEYEYIAVKTFTDADDPASASNENYLKLNTQGKVPTLVDGELILIESGAILNHIGRSAPAAGLIPEGDLAITAGKDGVQQVLVDLNMKDGSMLVAGYNRLDVPSGKMKEEKN